jgi:hypothetical protein
MESLNLLPCRGNLRQYNILASNILFDAVVSPFWACPARSRISCLQSSRPAARSSLLIRVLANQSKLSLLIHISVPKWLPHIGSGPSYPRGSGCLTRPPRADSWRINLTFKNWFESWRVVLGQEHSRREDLWPSCVHRSTRPTPWGSGPAAQVQLTLQCGPLLCVPKCQHTGPVGLEELGWISAGEPNSKVDSAIVLCPSQLYFKRFYTIITIHEYIYMYDILL